LKGGEKFREKRAEQREGAPAPAAGPGENPAMWAWNMMANMGKNAPPAKRKKKTK
jgi:hypothetical protein